MKSGVWEAQRVWLELRFHRLLTFVPTVKAATHRLVIGIWSRNKLDRALPKLVYLPNSVSHWTITELRYGISNIPTGCGGLSLREITQMRTREAIGPTPERLRFLQGFL